MVLFGAINLVLCASVRQQWTSLLFTRSSLLTRTLDEAVVFATERPFYYGIDLASADLPDYHYGEPQLARDSASKARLFQVCPYFLPLTISEA